nr:hypothetical protein [Tanacetum cinerariifolium]
MTSPRCAACKYFRRRCPSNCVFAPYFPNDNPQRFIFVHKIYGASNIAKMIEETPMHLRADAMDSLYYEAKCRIQDPVYGNVVESWTAESKAGRNQCLLQVTTGGYMVCRGTIITATVTAVAPCNIC